MYYGIIEIVIDHMFAYVIIHSKHSRIKKYRISRALTLNEMLLIWDIYPKFY